MARKAGKTKRSASGKTGSKGPRPGGENKADVKVSQDAPAKKKSVGPIQFLQQVDAERRKVTWTSRNETLVSTGVVLVMVVIMSLFFLLVDWGLRTVVQFILGL